MTRIEDDYACSVARGVQTTVVGAVGLAGKRAPLATALLRLFVGDNRSAGEIVRIMAGMALGKSYRLHSRTLAPTQADDIARAVLAWHRDGVCKHCQGRRWLTLGGNLLGGKAVLSNEHCPDCRGSGRIPLDRQFKGEALELARWLAAELDREQRIACVEAMKYLAERMP